jgi:hypothetical protein
MQDQVINYLPIKRSTDRKDPFSSLVAVKSLAGWDDCYAQVQSDVTFLLLISNITSSYLCLISGFTS